MRIYYSIYHQIYECYIIYEYVGIFISNMNVNSYSLSTIFHKQKNRWHSLIPKIILITVVIRHEWTMYVMHSAVIHTEIFEKKNWSSKLSESHHGVMVWCSGTIGSILMSFWALYRPLTQYLQNHGLQKWDFSKIQFLTSNHYKMH